MRNLFHKDIVIPKKVWSYFKEQNPRDLWCYIDMLTRVNKEAETVQKLGETWEVKPGEFLITLRFLAKCQNTPFSSHNKMLHRMIKSGIIRVQTRNKKRSSISLITICHYTPIQEFQESVGSKGDQKGDKKETNSSSSLLLYNNINNKEISQRASILSFVSEAPEGEAQAPSIDEKMELKNFVLGCVFRVQDTFYQHRMEKVPIMSPNDNAAIHIAKSKIKKWGNGNHFEGAKKLLALLDLSSQKWFSNTNSDFWFPTLRNIMKNSKLEQLEEEWDGEFNDDIWPDSRRFFDEAYADMMKAKKEAFMSKEGLRMMFEEKRLYSNYKEFMTKKEIEQVHGFMRTLYGEFEEIGPLVVEKKGSLPEAEH